MSESEKGDDIVVMTCDEVEASVDTVTETGVRLGAGTVLGVTTV